jgi:murein DD-endopeptidase MepM/ murein hydrolase activator NlpD
MIRVGVLRAGLVALLLLGGVGIRSLHAAPPEPSESTYVVQPGDTLTAVAARFGVPMAQVQRLNGLRDPRHLYPGQRLRLPVPVERAEWRARRLALGEDLGLIARRAGVDWTTLARANRLLNPAALLVGQTVLAPPIAATEVVTHASAADTRVAVAARHGVGLWVVLRHNTLPLYAGASVVLPATEVPGDGAAPLPGPIAALTLAPQPVTRGETAMLSLRTEVSATCTVAYLGVVEPCYAEDARHLHALVGIPPLLDPGAYTVTLRVATAEAATDLDLPLLVAPGRYDYERIDLPPDRQTLLDPARSQEERRKIAALRTLRTPERMWEYPFRFPLDASVTSYYGSRRSYGYGFTSFHGGTDFQGETGMPVYAPASGVVVLAEPLVVRGNAILIDHGWGVVTGYWHLSEIDVAVGEVVAQGQQIARLGDTGLSTGPHLHWELWVNGVSVSALQWVTDFGPTSSAP